MKEIKAYVHRGRIAGVIRALRESGLCDFGGRTGGRNVTVYEVKGSLDPLEPDEQHYSLDLAEAVVHEFKLELICEDHQADQLVELIRMAARTGQENAGWICVVDLERAVPIGSSRGLGDQA
jgi:nitrogen regulatory protein P-II 1